MATHGGRTAGRCCSWHHRHVRRSSFVSALALAIMCTMGLGCSPSTPPPSLVSAAPPEANNCIKASIRLASLDPATILDALDGHVPTALPTGFGLLGLWGVGEGRGEMKGYAIWADDSCRTVAVGTWVVGDPVGEGPRVGAFTLTSEVPSTCVRPGPAPCLAYRARLSPGLVEVAVVGIDRSAADEIVRSME